MAYYSNKNDKVFVAEAQRMLRSLSRWIDEPGLSVAVDGSYDEGTRTAVAYYQSTHDLPATGDLDFNTWETIREEYTYYEELYSPPRGIIPLPTIPDYSVKSGERGTLIFIVQLMLNELLQFYDSYGYIPPNGRYTDSTEAAVREFQRLNGLPATGEIDRRTWNRLAGQYNLTVNEY